MHRRAQVLEQIHHPIPAVRRLDDHRRRIARLGDHRRELKRGVVHTVNRESLTRTPEPHDHRTSTVKIDPDILSIHRGLLLFTRVKVWKPRVSTTSSEPSRGAEAPLLPRLTSVRPIW